MRIISSSVILTANNSAEGENGVGYVVGVDGGGTKTTAVVGDHWGRILSVGQAAGSNHQISGIGPAAQEVKAAVDRALQGAGIALGLVDAMAFGLAGMDTIRDRRILEPALEEIFPGIPYTLMNDSLVALRAGDREGAGAVVIAGTGTNTAGRNHRGEVIIVGGMGYRFGDWGSAFNIGTEAVRYVFQAWQGRRPPTLLTEPVLAGLGCANVDELRDKMEDGRITNISIANIAPVVGQCAVAGDAAAQEIVIAAGEALGRSAAAALERLGMEREAVPVFLAGGVFRAANPLLVDSLSLALHRRAPRARVHHLARAPVVGAYLFALERASLDVSPGLWERLNEHLPPELFNLPEDLSTAVV